MRRVFIIIHLIEAFFRVRYSKKAYDYILLLRTMSTSFVYHRITVKMVRFLKASCLKRSLQLKAS